MQTTVRLLSAFLFSVVILAIGHFGAWWFAARQAEQQVMGTLQQMPGVSLTHGAVSYQGYPTKVTLAVKGLKFNWVNAAKDMRAELDAGDVTISTGMFNLNKTEVALARQQHLAVYGHGKLLRKFDVVMEGGRLSNFVRGNSTEHTLSVDTLTLWDVTQPNQRTAALRSTASYITRETPGARTAADWRLSFNNLHVGPSLVGTTQQADRLLFSVGTPAGLFQTQGDTLLHLIAVEAPVRQQALRQFLVALQRSGAAFYVDGMQLNQGKFWFTLRGLFQVAESGQPQMSGSVNTNNLEKTLDFLVANKLAERTQLDNNRGLERLLRPQDGTYNLALEVDEGRCSLNGIQVGIAPTLQQLFGLAR